MKINLSVAEVDENTEKKTIFWKNGVLLKIFILK